MAGKPVRIPAAAERAWVWFWQLDYTRNGNGYSANRLTFVDIGHWSAMTGHRPDAWELDALLKMDAERLILMRGDVDTGGDVMSERELTPELFDALF